MKKYNILIVTPFYLPIKNGTAIHMHQIAKSFSSKGHNVDVITLNINSDNLYSKKIYFNNKEIIDDINVIRYKVTILPAHTRVCRALEHIDYFKYYCGYRRLFSNNLLKHNISQYDLIIMGVMPFTGIIYPLLKKAKKKNIMTAFMPLIHFGIPHDNRFEYEYFSQDCINLYKMSDIIIVNSNIERDFLRKHKYKGKIIQINPYIDINCDNEKNINNDFYICTLGYNNFEKGIDTSLKAFNRFSQNHENVFFEIGGKIEKQYEEIAKKNNKIIIHNEMNDKQKIEMFKRCDLFVQASMSESLGLATLEAHRCKIPSINAYCSGSMSIIKNGENGFLIPFGDDYLMYEYLELLYNSREKWKQMSDNANKLSFNYDYDNHKKGIDLLEKCINENN